MSAAEDGGARAAGIVAERDLPGEVIFEHPGDIRVSQDERIVRTLRVVLPDGDFGYLLVPAPWGAPYSADDLEGRERRILEEAARDLGDDEGPRPASVLERSHRLVRRD